jgi:hypothetical protein
MKKGISIWSFGNMSVEETLKLAKKAGFDGVELALNMTGEASLESDENEWKKIKKMADDIGISLYSVACGLYWDYSLTSDDENERKKAEEIVKKEIDMAKALGTVGAVSGIRRTRIGHLNVSDAVKSEDLCEASLMKPQDCMKFPVVTLTDKQVEALRQGREMTWNKEPIQIEEGAPNMVLAVDKEGDLKAGCSFENGKLAPKFYLGSD